MSIESVPTAWDTARDDAFFRIVNHLFPARDLEGMSSLLQAKCRGRCFGLLRR